MAKIVLLFQRNKGPKHQGLYSIVWSQKRLDRLMYWRFLRLRLTSHGSSKDYDLGLRKTLQNSELVFEDRKFSGEELNLIFDFFRRLVEEEDTLEIIDGQIIVAFTHLLPRNCENQYRSAPNITFGKQWWNNLLD